MPKQQLTVFIDLIFRLQAINIDEFFMPHVMLHLPKLYQ